MQYTVGQTDDCSPGSFGQLLTGNPSHSVLLLPYSKPCDQAMVSSMPHMGSLGYGSSHNSAQPGAAAMSAIPEPYQILMPVQMADGRVRAMPPQQSQVRCLGCLFDCCFVCCCPTVLSFKVIPHFTCCCPSSPCYCTQCPAVVHLTCDLLCLPLS